jgi:hypothetical protein
VEISRFRANGRRARVNAKRVKAASETSKPCAVRQDKGGSQDKGGRVPTAPPLRSKPPTPSDSPRATPETSGPKGPGPARRSGGPPWRRAAFAGRRGRRSDARQTPVRPRPAGNGVGILEIIVLLLLLLLLGKWGSSHAWLHTGGERWQDGGGGVVRRWVGGCGWEAAALGAGTIDWTISSALLSLLLLLCCCCCCCRRLVVVVVVVVVVVI